jgi:Na+/proline symporter
LFGLLAGVARSSTLYFAAGWSFLYVAWWSFVGALIVTVVVSLLTRPEPTSKLEGLVYGLVMKDDEIQDVLSRRAEGGE